MAKIIIKIFCFFMLSSVCLANIDFEDPTLQVEQDTITKKQVFKQYLKTILPANMFFGPYAFMYGVAIGGGAIVDGDSPLIANTKWLVAPLLGGALIQLANKDFTYWAKQDLKSSLINSPENDNSTLYYNIFYVGTDISSIKDFNAEGEDGKWSANVIEAKTSIDYPPLGYRTGFSTNTFGMDFETSLLAHHTIKDSIYYSFDGQIYNEDYNMYVDLPAQLKIGLPTHFLMLHSLYMGLNMYYVLPDFGVKPYLGAGAGILLNSIQSQYPGPANLAQEDGALALDEMEWNWGYHGLFGFRYMKEKSFYYVEFRPTIHNFEYDSGSGRLKEHDQFVLQSFQIQIGIGKSIF
jgi:hypothetical protein